MIYPWKYSLRSCVVTLFVLIIAAISIHDAALIVLNDEVIVHSEQNPVGRWLLNVSGGHVALFVISKLIGTTTVCATIFAFLRFWPRLVVAISSAVAGFQVVLLTYLTSF